MRLLANNTMTRNDFITEREATRLAWLLELERRVPIIERVDTTDANARRLWQACELCIYLEHRTDVAPDPRQLSEAEIATLGKRALGRGEGITDLIDDDLYWYYWLMCGGERVGTLALDVRDWGWQQPQIMLASLYVFPEHRRRGCAGDALVLLECACATLGLRGVWLNTHWTWQPNVRFYLNRGFWVQSWKRDIRFYRRPDSPRFRVQPDGDALTFVVDGRDAPALRAERDGTRLRLELHPSLEAGELTDRLDCIETFSVWLAVLGWPLIRDDEAWARRHGWSDCGMPEGLAYKIQVFEAYDRHRGFPVHTPRVPGLSYPSWEALQAED